MCPRDITSRVIQPLASRGAARSAVVDVSSAPLGGGLGWRAHNPTLPRSAAQLRAPFAEGAFAGLSIEEQEDWLDSPDSALGTISPGRRSDCADGRLYRVARAQGIAHAAAPLSTVDAASSSFTAPPRDRRPRDLLSPHLKIGRLRRQAPFVLSLRASRCEAPRQSEGAWQPARADLAMACSTASSGSATRRRAVPRALHLLFGKGQMETVLNFPPGIYTLRLFWRTRSTSRTAPTARRRASPSGARRMRMTMSLVAQGVGSWRPANLRRFRRLQRSGPRLGLEPFARRPAGEMLRALPEVAINLSARRAH